MEIALQKSLGESTMGKRSTPYRPKFSFYEVFHRRLQHSGFSAYAHANLEKVKGFRDVYFNFPEEIKAYCDRKLELKQPAAIASNFSGMPFFAAIKAQLLWNFCANYDAHACNKLIEI